MLTLAASGALAKGGWLGTMSLTGIAGLMVVALWLGVRGSDRVPINTKERITGWGLITGSMCVAAGGNWLDVITGLGTIPTSIIQQSGFSDFGPAAVGGICALISFAHGFKRRWINALLSLAASKFLIDAGGIGAIVLNAARATIGHWGGTG
ncbi:hypothetical protein ACFUEN_29000 [Streptomyces griseorubiginosus]|uniref:hypothetical protein n=1 Tax=Streptomyces griseorubiginosus TaxID=67304 RepID=UPI003636AEAC